MPSTILVPEGRQLPVEATAPPSESPITVTPHQGLSEGYLGRVERAPVRQSESVPSIAAQANVDPADELANVGSLSVQDHQSKSTPHPVPTSPTTPSTPASTPPKRGSQAQPASREGSEPELRWYLKQVNWRGRQRRIVIQNENGPCSLIALANVLILRGEVAITPASLKTVTFGHLSTLLAGYLLDEASQRGPDAEADVTAALTALPSTQTGLDMNVRFDRCDAFASAAPGSAGGGDGARALFQLAGVRLVHGWLPDQEDVDVSEALRCAADYDAALALIADADSISSGAVVGSAAGSPFSSSNLQDVNPEQKQKVQDALALKRFFESSATQLTYTGLFALTQTLHPGELAAFFRNSHVSVIYRKEDGDALEEAPPLYLLATDLAWLHHENVVWESLADVDQAASEFFDGALRVTRPQNMRESRMHSQHAETVSARAQARSEATAPRSEGVVQDDALLAQQLQEEEYGGLRSGTDTPPPTYTPSPKEGERRQQGGGTVGGAASGSPFNLRDRPFRPQPPPAALDVPRPVAPPRREQEPSARPKYSGPRGFGKKNECLIM